MNLRDLDVTYVIDKLLFIEQDITGIDDYMGIGANAYAKEFHLAYTGELI